MSIPRGRLAPIVLFAAALGMAAPVAPARAGEQYALLVAVQDYPKTEFNPLRFTRDDMIEFRRVLLDSGFRDDHVTLMHDRQARPELLPEIKKIRKQLDLLLAVAGRDDTLIVALSGHGIDFAGDKHSYFCPLDGEVGDKSSLLDLDELYGKLKDCKAQRKLLLADCCRNDPQSKIGKSARPEVDLESVSRPQTRDVPEGVVALFSCSAGEKSWEPDDLKHGVFFNFVLKGWRGAAADKDGKVTLDGLVAYAASETETYARVNLEKVQRPQKKNEFSGEWVLNGRPSDTTVTTQPTPTPSGEPLTLKGHTADVWCAAFSHNGKLVASGSLDKTVKLWDSATGEERGTLKGPAKLIRAVAFGAQDLTLLGVGGDDSVWLWDVAKGTELWHRTTAKDAVSAAFSPDGARAAVGAEKGLLMLDPDGHEVWSRTDLAQVWAVAFSPDGDRVACVEQAGTVSVFRAKTGAPVWKNTLPTYSWCLAYRPDGSALAVCPTKSKSVLLFRAADGKRLDVFPAADKDVCGIDFRPDGKVLATASFLDKSISLWDATTFKPKGTPDGHEEMVRCVAFSPDGKRLVSASLDKTVKIWDVDPKK